VPRALLALLLASAVAPCAQARDALQVIEECVAKLDTELDVGYARIAARCPDLTVALSESPWAPWLPQGWNRPDNSLSAAGLSELRALLAREAGPVLLRRPPPHAERAAAVLAEVVRSDASGLGWWQRFKQWLRTIFSARPATDNHWLTRWLREIRLSSSTTQLIAWSGLALVVTLAVGIIINELRIAGFLPGGAGRTRAGAPSLAGAGRQLALEDIERAEPERQPGLLLELIALRLTEQERLPPARALTARELERRARLPDDSCRTRLGQLVQVCERLRFSGERVSAARFAAALREGRLLLAALEAPSSIDAAVQAH